MSGFILSLSAMLVGFSVAWAQRQSVTNDILRPSVWRNMNVASCGQKLDPPIGCQSPTGIWLCQSIIDGPNIYTGWACISPTLEHYEKPVQAR